LVIYDAQPRMRKAKARRHERSPASLAPAQGSLSPPPVDDISQVISVETQVSSEDGGWRGLETSRFRYATEGFCLPGFAGHAVVVHLGPTAELIEREEGRFHRAMVRRGDVSVVPAGLESEWWWEDGREVDRLHTYFDPAVLLKSTDLPVGTASRSVGFASPSHFSQQFKRIVGAPPGALR
jgi:hypothetical protein